MNEKVYLDLLPTKKVGDLSVDDCLIINETAYAIQEFPDGDQTVIVTQAGENVNIDEPLQMELSIANLQGAIKAGRVKKHGRFVRG